jgi:hypothetical protein
MVKNGGNLRSKAEIVRAFGQMFIALYSFRSFLYSTAFRFKEQLYEIKNHTAYMRACIETTLFTPDYGIGLT